MRTLLLMLLAACSCSTLAPKPDEQRTGCYTYCGLYADRLPDGWTCNDLQRIENLTVTYTLRFSTDTPAMMGARACDLHHWVLFVVDEAAWFHNQAGNILGLTSCDDKQIFINNTSKRKNSLSHEYLHAFQNCRPEGTDGGTVTDAHQNWEENGLYGVVESVRSRD